MPDFYCDPCHRWTCPDPIDLDAPADTPVLCSTCGESYHCDECGFEISSAGLCLRPAELGTCPSRAVWERRFAVLKDGVQHGASHPTPLDALGALHTYVGYSALHAIAHEGWEIRPVQVVA